MVLDDWDPEEVTVEARVREGVLPGRSSGACCMNEVRVGSRNRLSREKERDGRMGG